MTPPSAAVRRAGSTRGRRPAEWVLPCSGQATNPAHLAKVHAEVLVAHEVDHLRETCARVAGGCESTAVHWCRRPPAGRLQPGHPHMHARRPLSTPHAPRSSSGAPAGPRRACRLPSGTAPALGAAPQGQQGQAEGSAQQGMSSSWGAAASSTAAFLGVAVQARPHPAPRSPMRARRRRRRQGAVPARGRGAGRRRRPQPRAWRRAPHHKQSPHPRAAWARACSHSQRQGGSQGHCATAGRRQRRAARTGAALAAPPAKCCIPRQGPTAQHCARTGCAARRPVPQRCGCVLWRLQAPPPCAAWFAAAPTRRARSRRRCRRRRAPPPAPPPGAPRRPCGR